MSPKRPRNKVWAYFDVSPDGDKMAVCKLCLKDYSFKTTVSNLKKHLQNKHSDQILPEMLEDENSSVYEEKTTDGNSLKRKSTDSNEEYKEQSDAGAGDNDGEWKMDDLLKVAKQKHKSNCRGSKRTSTLWHFFDDVSRKNEGKAECRLCHAMLSHKTSISNLKTHLTNKHPSTLKELNRLPSFNESAGEVQNADENGDVSDNADCKDEYSMDDYEVLEEVLVPDTLEGSVDPDAADDGGEADDKDTAKSIPSFSVRLKNKKILEPTRFLEHTGTKKKPEPADKWTQSCEKFGAYVASLMLQIPKHVAANYQVQIVKRLMDESLKYGDGNLNFGS